MPSTKDIQRRIKSVNNTKKITKAMEMVAASKMRKAVDAVLKTRTYANLSWETILNLSVSAGIKHPLIKDKDKKEEKDKVLLVLISSNRGLCGGFNVNIIEKAHKSIQLHEEKTKGSTDIVVIGKKGSSIRNYYGYNIVAEFPKLDIISEVREVYPVVKMIMDDFKNNKYTKVMVAYTDFVNPVKQVPRVKQLLPIDINAEEEYLGIVGKDSRVGLDKEFIEKKKEKHLGDEKYSFEYTFEPNPKEVLDEMIPRLIEVQLFQALLESNASEHSARMTAMHKANDAASDLVNDLILYYNKARQASITNEIAEISAGANALK